MGERSEERKEQYKRIRTEFEDLQIEDKALFLFEAMVSTVARGIEQVGRGFAEEVDNAFRRAARSTEEAEAGAAERNGASVADEGAPAPNVSPEEKPKPKSPKSPGNPDEPIL